MKLIAVISHKGGAGKTTSAVQLAEEMARRGQRTLLVDADRQQGAGLLLGIDAPAGCVQQTMVAGLSYLGSARLTDLEIADCYASVASRFDIGIVDTPSLDDVLARGWLREAAAILMVLQVDPLTVKTLPSALNTLEVVRALKPTIQILGLLPTMFDPTEEAHSRLLAELLARKPDAVFTPVVPQDPALMHRANAEECPPLGEAARQAYQCAVDRILRALTSAEPSVALPHNSQQRVRPPWAHTPVQPAQPQPQAQPAHTQIQTPAPMPAQAPPPLHSAAAPPTGTPPTAAFPAMPEMTAPTMGAASKATRPAAGWDDPADAALETLAGSRVEAAADTNPHAVPEWDLETRVDERGIARRKESWLVRSRFAIACTVACLALIAVLVLGTLKRTPVSGDGPSNLSAALAAVRQRQDAPEGDEKTPPEKAKPRKMAGQKASGTPGELSKSGKSRGK